MMGRAKDSKPPDIMKRNPLLVAFLLAIALAGRAQTPVPGPADAEIAAITALAEAPAPGDPKVMGTEPYLRAVDDNRRKLTAAAFAFYDTHPADPRRWDMAMKAAMLPPLFVQSYGPEVATKGLRDAVIDQAAKTAWQEKVDGIKAALRVADDVSPAVREVLEWEDFGRDFRAVAQAKSQGKPFDFGPLKPRFAAHLAKFAGQPVLPNRAADYLVSLERMMPGEGMAGWKQLLESPDEAVRARAIRQLGAAERRAGLATRPFELAFLAADGRAVDVAKLRGKVVLIDFWATWCGPCIAELPNIKNVYAAYHDKGFEIIGISLENPGANPKDSAEQAAAKLAKAKAKMLAFTVENQMPWPQYFDGKWWNNDIATQYDIMSIPAMFLLDQEGKVVSTNARRPTLEAEVKSLLKL